MSRRKTEKIIRPDRIISYFRLEKGALAVITVSGILYNVGMVVGPYFEGQLVQCLYDIMRGEKTLSAMLSLSALYLAVILAVQGMRAVKRFGVRRFANDTSRNMRHMLYNSLVHMSRAELYSQSLGSIMTKAVADVDACSEGMRKFTTEIFDTGVVLAAYLVMLFSYDWRLALVASAFTPAAYIIAGLLRRAVSKSNSAYKKSAGRLNSATMDRVGNAITYRVYGREKNRDEAYGKRLEDYEKRAVSANLWENTMQPIYNIISMFGAVLIIYFGAKNVQGGGWTAWNVAAFTTFLSCFTKMALKSSKAAKLFNAVQKAEVSWSRIKPLMKDYIQEGDAGETIHSAPLLLSGVSVFWDGGENVLSDISFCARPGQIIGITGPVACGKSTLGKLFIGEAGYTGSVKIGERELSHLTQEERCHVVSYMGHEPELVSDTVGENIRLGRPGDISLTLRAVCLDGEVSLMENGEDTPVGNGGVRLSGGQQARVALARTLYNAADILVLDDPFSAVDKETEKKIFESIRKASRDKIVLLISHRLSLFPILDGVLFLSGGGGVFESHDGLMKTSPEYAGLYLEQTKGGDLDEEN